MFWPSRTKIPLHLDRLATMPYQNLVASLMCVVPDILEVLNELVFVGSSQTSALAVFLVGELGLEPIVALNLSMMGGGVFRTQSLALHNHSTRSKVLLIAVMADVQIQQSIFGNGADKFKCTKLCCWDVTKKLAENKAILRSKPNSQMNDENTEKILSMLTSVESRLSNRMDEVMKSVRTCEQRLTKIESTLRHLDSAQGQFHGV